MANAHFIRHLQRLSMPILAIAAINGSPEVAALLSLRAAIVCMLKTSRFYARVLPTVAEAEDKARPDEEMERIAREGRVDLLRGLRMPLTTTRSRLLGIKRETWITAASSRRRGDAVGFGVRREGRWEDSWTLRQLCAISYDNNGCGVKG